jgi:hypothetical protein
MISISKPRELMVERISKPKGILPIRVNWFVNIINGVDKENYSHVPSLVLKLKCNIQIDCIFFAFGIHCWSWELLIFIGVFNRLHWGWRSGVMRKKVTDEKNPTIGDMSRNLNFKVGIKTPTHVSGISGLSPLSQLCRLKCWYIRL